MADSRLSSVVNPAAVTPEMLQALDDQLSKRFIALDPAGYLLIRVDADAKELVVEHYRNDVDAQGRATDPDTGEVLGCRGGVSRAPERIYRAKTAKQLGIQLSEGDGPLPISKLDHALYLGRELQKAELAMLQGVTYRQD
jgi:dihydropteroate synthase